MAAIALLSQDTIDKIAAGEVIERPSSVVKELVENAIDANATAVTIEIKEGGTSLIRITDNGCGIAQDQVALAFLRHSTSKIRSAEELMGVRSLGFRGEALSSIAAVSRVELITKTVDSLTGVRYVIEGGREQELEEIGAPDGTTFLVKDLFYNTPARRKFLKTPHTEGNYIGDLVERLALSHPEISFKYVNNGQTKLHTSGNGSRRDLIYHIYGRDITASLLPVEHMGEFFSVEGFIGRPTVTRGNRNFESYFINQRYIKSTLIARAIEEAYQSFIMQHQYPFTVLYFTFDGQRLDVNVHPTKMELRFEHGREISAELSRVLREVLAGQELIPRVPVHKERVRPMNRKGGDTNEGGQGRHSDEARPQSFPEEVLDGIRNAVAADSPYAPQYGGHIRKQGTAYGSEAPYPTKSSATSPRSQSDAVSPRQSAGEVPCPPGSSVTGFVGFAEASAAQRPAGEAVSLSESFATSPGTLAEASAAQQPGGEAPCPPESSVTGSAAFSEASVLQRPAGETSYLPEPDVSSRRLGLDVREDILVYGASRGGEGQAEEHLPGNPLADLPTRYSDKLVGQAEDSGVLMQIESRLEDIRTGLLEASKARENSDRPAMGVPVEAPKSYSPMGEGELPGPFSPMEAESSTPEPYSPMDEVEAATYEELTLSSIDSRFLSDEARSNHRIIGQLFGTYWLVEYDEKLYIIDQHAAHEKVLYERTIARLAEKEFTSQMISPPIILTLDSREIEMLEKYRPQIEQLGYVVEPFGGKEYQISAIPGNLYHLDMKDLFIEMLDDFSNLSGRETPQLITEKVASMSCKAAVKGNSRLSMPEIEQLITDLLSLENPYNCPHGRPTIISMTKYEIEKGFKRIV